MAVNNPSLISHRSDPDSQTAIIFIHGFDGDPQSWNSFCEYLKDEPNLSGWDIHSLGYSTVGLKSLDFWLPWRKLPSIELLGVSLGTMTGLKALKRYKSLVLIAHSMGGLVTQQALVTDDDAFQSKVTHVFLFGTPSGGVGLARHLGMFNRQARDLSSDSDFITNLRKKWANKYNANIPFKLWAIAGQTDPIVSSKSAHSAFPESAREGIAGDHSAIVRPESPDAPSVEIVVKGITTGSVTGGRLESARLALHRSLAQDTIDAYLPAAATLEQWALVELALALESTGKSDQALEVLRQRKDLDLDAKGTLAGRLKRKWLDVPTEKEGKSALDLYSSAYAEAKTSNDFDQARYHGINVAYMTLAQKRDAAGAKAVAEEVLDWCDEIPTGDLWHSATVGEALIHLNRPTDALDAYRDAAKTGPDARQVQSLYLQAVGTAKRLRMDDFADDLAAVLEEELQI